jgi:hypothetical protein
VLYRENYFSIRRVTHYVLNSWRLLPVHLELISKACLYPRDIAEIYGSLKPLTGLKELRILIALSVEDFDAFLQQTPSFLKCISKVVVQFYLPEKEIARIARNLKWTSSRLRDDLDVAAESLCIAAYQPALGKRRALWVGKTTKLRFFDISDFYGLNWNLEFFINDS